MQLVAITYHFMNTWRNVLEASKHHPKQHIQTAAKETFRTFIPLLWIYCQTVYKGFSRVQCSSLFFVCCFYTEFLIQYEDKLHHRGDWHNLTEVLGTKTTAHLKLSPYVHYSFRVLALNAVGFSRPSLPSRVFKTEAAGTNSAALW